MTWTQDQTERFASTIGAVLALGAIAAGIFWPASQIPIDTRAELVAPAPLVARVEPCRETARSFVLPMREAFVCPHPRHELHDMQIEQWVTYVCRCSYAVDRYNLDAGSAP